MVEIVEAVARRTLDFQSASLHQVISYKRPGPVQVDLPRCFLSSAVALPCRSMAAGARAVGNCALAAAEEEASADQADETTHALVVAEPERVCARDGAGGARGRRARQRMPQPMMLTT